MKTKKLILSFTLVIVCMMVSCVNDQTQQKPLPKQLNITVLLDLSDRISPDIHPATPSHVERDTAIIMEIVKIFKQEIKKTGAINAKGMLRVEMLPWPKIANINNIQKELDVDCSRMTPKEKKVLFDNIDSSFSQALSEIYSETIRTCGKRKWIGSDIWRFFKSNIDMYIEKDTNCYRNILIILTDGYIYHKQSVQQNGHRYSYLTEPLIVKEGLNKGDFKTKIETLDFGLIATRNDLSNVEVLFLELAPLNNLDDFDIMKIVLTKWCNEMGINKVGIYKTDLPINTAKAIDLFFKR